MSSRTLVLPLVARTIGEIEQLIRRELADALAVGALPGAKEFQVTGEGAGTAPTIRVLVTMFPHVEAGEIAAVTTEVEASIRLDHAPMLTASQRRRTDSGFAFAIEVT